MPELQSRDGRVTHSGRRPRKLPELQLGLVGVTLEPMSRERTEFDAHMEKQASLAYLSRFREEREESDGGDESDRSAVGSGCEGP